MVIQINPLRLLLLAITMSCFAQTPNISDIGLCRVPYLLEDLYQPLVPVLQEHQEIFSPPNFSFLKHHLPHHHNPTPALKNFDPTYGLRPEGSTLQKGFSSLFNPTQRFLKQYLKVNKTA